MNLRSAFLIIFFLFLVFSIIFWKYTDEFFYWIYGYDLKILGTTSDLDREAFARTARARQIFFFITMIVSIACFVISLLSIRRGLYLWKLPYVAIFLSGMAVFIFLLLLLGGGMIPTRSIF